MSGGDNVQVAGSGGRDYVAGLDVNSSVPHSISNPHLVTRGHSQSQPGWESFAPTWAQATLRMGASMWAAATETVATEVMAHLRSMANTLSGGHFAAGATQVQGNSQNASGSRMESGSKHGGAEPFSPTPSQTSDVKSHFESIMAGGDHVFPTLRMAGHQSSGSHSADHRQSFTPSDFGGKGVQANQARGTESQATTVTPTAQGGALSGQGAAGLGASDPGRAGTSAMRR